MNNSLLTSICKNYAGLVNCIRINCPAAAKMKIVKSLYTLISINVGIFYRACSRSGGKSSTLALDKLAQ